MRRRTFLIAPAAVALAACAGPQTTALSGDDRRALRVGAVQIVTDGTFFDGEGAQERRNRLAPDLTAELRDEFRDRVAATGWVMQVEVARLAVIGGTATALGRDQSELSGTVRLVDPTGRLRASVPITVTAGAARESVTGRVVGAATGGRGRFYETLLEDFAREARTLILGGDLPGQRLVRRVGG